MTSAALPRKVQATPALLDKARRMRGAGRKRAEALRWRWRDGFSAVDQVTAFFVERSEKATRPLFFNLSDEDIAIFQNAALVRSYKKGKIIYIQDEPAQLFYIIIGGWIKLFHTMPEGEEVIVDMLTAS